MTGPSRIFAFDRDKNQLYILSTRCESNIVLPVLSLSIRESAGLVCPETADKPLRDYDVINVQTFKLNVR